MDTLFHQNLASHIRQNDMIGANSVVMGELGKIAVNHRTDFIDLLNHSDVPAHGEMADAQLVKLYFDNIQKKEMLIGTAFLVNMHNKTARFDGSSEVSNIGVRAAYKAMSSSLVGPVPNSTIEYERQKYKNVDWIPEDTSGFIWDTVAKGAVGITGKVLDGQNKKKYGAVDALQAQQQAKADLAKSMIAQRQAQIDAAAKAKELKSKNLKIGLIVGGSVLAIAIGGLIYYKLKNK